MGAWHDSDPRHTMDWTSGTRIGLYLPGGYIVGATVETKHGWSVTLDRDPGPGGSVLHDDLDASTEWPSGWRWTPLPD